MDVRLLVVGGPQCIALGWTDDFVAAGMTVKTVTNGSDALRHLELLEPDVLVIDVHLDGDLDGFDTCRAIRSRSEAIVIFVAACPGPFDEVVSLAVGGDHFLTASTPGPIVTAHVRALLRRARGAVRVDGQGSHDGSASGSANGSSNGSSNGAAPHADGPLDELQRVTEGDLEIDVVAREVRVKGEPAHLTRIEFDLLVTLARNPRRVFTREQLMMGVWGEPFDGSHVLDTHLSRLRRKIDSVGGDRVAHAVRGVGFRLRS